MEMVEISVCWRLRFCDLGVLSFQQPGNHELWPVALAVKKLPNESDFTLRNLRGRLRRIRDKTLTDRRLKDENRTCRLKQIFEFDYEIEQEIERQSQPTKRPLKIKLPSKPQPENVIYLR